MSVSLRKVAKFKLNQEVQVAASGWGLAPALIGKKCTITAIHCYNDKVIYKVSGLDCDPSLVSNDVWEQSFKEILLTVGQQAASIADKMEVINKAIEKLKSEREGLLTDLLALVG
jgi:peptide deformylase